VTTTAGSRLEHLDGLRGLAALYVFLSHAYLTVWPMQHLPSGPLRAITGWLLYAHFAVDLFLVLSGYCLMLPVLRAGGALSGGVGPFLWRRVRRIVPPYWAACALALGLIATCIGQKTGTHWDMCVPVSPQALIFYPLLLQDVFSAQVGGQINHAFWSIAVEAHLYLVFPLLVLLWRRSSPWIFVGVSAVVAMALSRLVTGTPYYQTTPHYLLLLALGMAAAGIAQRPPRLPWGAIALGCVALVAAFCLWRSPSVVFVSFPKLDPLIGLGSAALLVLLAQRDSALRRIVSARPLTALGTISYSFYLIHAPLLQVLWQYGLHPWVTGGVRMFVLLVLGGLVTIVPAAFLFWRLFERPFFTAKKPLTPARGAR
jgi:peptidoglycan/LPS O-acetylase OafA/YrhL